MNDAPDIRELHEDGNWYWLDPVTGTWVGPFADRDAAYADYDTWAWTRGYN